MTKLTIYWQEPHQINSLFQTAFFKFVFGLNRLSETLRTILPQYRF